MFSIDALCRRSSALQATVHATGGFLGLHPADAQRLGLAAGQSASVSQGEASAALEVRVDERVPEGGAWIPAGTCATRSLGAAMGPVTVRGGQG
jgi:NADH-quinone oxidoreductase subunit G